LWTRPSSRGWTEPCELAVCLLPAVPHRAAAQTRRRLRAGHRAEPVVCRCRCLPQHARSLLYIVLILSRQAHAEFRLAVGTHTVAPPTFGTHSHVHPRAESLSSFVQPVHTCAPLGPKFYLFWVGDSWPTHTVVARNVGAADLSSPLQSFPAVPSCLVGNFTVRSDARAREVVRLRMCLTNAAGPFLAVFPFFVPLPRALHQFCVAAMAVPSAFSTHTNAGNRGAEPLLHLSVTVLDLPSCRHREPLCTGTRVSVEPSTPSSNLFDHLDPEHRLA
jgi:hypothetical protein